MDSSSQSQRQRLAKIAHEASYDVTFENPKLIGTVNGPEKHIPPQWRDSRMMNRNEYEDYIVKANKSKGYDVSGCTGRLVGGIGELRGRGLENARLVAHAAVEEHNNDKGTELEYLEVMKANGQAVSGLLYFITLKALDKRDQQEKVYRVKVWFHPHMYEEMGKEMTILEFYEAPTHKKKSGGRKKQGVSHQASRGLTKGRKEKTGSKPKRPFDIFVKELRELPEFSCTRYCKVMKIAGTKWRSMSAEDKASYKGRAVSRSMEVKT